MQKIALSCLMLFLVTFGSHAMAQMTVMIPAYEMTCVPKNPVTGPDGIAHQYAPYQLAWDGQNRMIIRLAGTDGMGNAVRVKRVSEKIALMQSSGGTHAYAVRLDFQRGSAAYDYGRVDKCTVAETAPTTPEAQASCSNPSSSAETRDCDAKRVEEAYRQIEVLAARKMDSIKADATRTFGKLDDSAKAGLSQLRDAQRYWRLYVVAFCGSAQTLGGSSAGRDERLDCERAHQALRIKELE
jgi:lysozyme inhibitor LprI